MAGPSVAVRLAGKEKARVSSAVTAERTARNFLCHLSGVATLTRRFVERAASAGQRERAVECDRLEQVSEPLEAGATVVLCDNMSPDDVKVVVGMVAEHPRRAAGAVLVEASGGVGLENVAAYAAAGADLVSIGALTHSAPILHIGLDLACS